MADISSGDVQRIVNDAANQLRGTLNDLRSQVTQMSRETDEVARIRQQMEDVSRRIMNVEQQMQQIIQLMQATQQSVAGNQQADQYTVVMAQQLAELRTRFQTVERFAAQMSDYVQRIRAREQENEDYKHLGG